MIKFVNLNGYLENSSFISIAIEGGDPNDSIGDQIWISKDGKTMEVYDMADDDVLEEAKNLFEPASKWAFKGALRRLDLTW